MPLDLDLVGSILYRCEGSRSKSNIKMVEFVNSDPELIRIFIKYLLEIHNIEKDKIILRLQLHEDNNESESMEYWRTITGLPNARFHKTIIKKTNPLRKNNYKRLEFGLCLVRVNSTSLRREIIKRCYSIFK